MNCRRGSVCRGHCGSQLLKDYQVRNNNSVFLNKQSSMYLDTLNKFSSLIIPEERNFMKY